MNVIFPLITLVSVILLAFSSPETMLNTFSSSVQTSVNLLVTLLGVYCVWQGVANLLEKSGLSNKIAKILKKPIKKLFETDCDETIYQISLNLTANALGLSGVATPAGIESMKLLDDQNNQNAKTMLAVISSTSIQILPVSVTQLLVSYGQNPSLIIILSLISTTVSTLLGILLCKVFR